MIRTLMLFAAVFLALSAGGELLAQDAWPAYSTGNPDPNAIVRGPGSYFALWKLIFLAVIFFAWVKSVDWVGRDTAQMGEAIGMPPKIWNPVVVFPFLLGFLAAITIPFFIAGWGFMLLTYAVPFGVYVAMRNGRVTGEQKVFTPDHIKNILGNLGKREQKERETKHAWQSGPPVELTAVGPLQMENQQAMIEARQSEGYVPLKYLIADALPQRAERIMLEFTQDAVGVRYQIDGMWHSVTPKVHPKEPLSRQQGDSMLAAIKRISHLKPQERRAKQEGKLRVEFEGNKYDTAITSQGTQTGERAILHLSLISKHVPELPELGMRDKMRDQLKAAIGPGNKGLVVFAALPGDGLSRTWRAALRSTDRLMRDFISIEEAHKVEPDVENVDVQKYDATKGEKSEDGLKKLMLKQPEVICIPELASGEALTQLCQWITREERFGLISLRAKEGCDALLRLLALKAPPDVVSSTVKTVIYTRLVRKLCETCRQAVQPTPELLQRLGIPAGRVQVLYQEKQPLQPGETRKRGEPEICPDCKGLGYKGRIGIFEFVAVDDKMRQALLKAPTLDTLKKLSRAAGNRTLQEEGVLLVAMGTTSLSELQRVLKQ
jgi:type II secretory ATPase GspE/PulE/Tfp pilus assembly ATPase PilB-like protein